MDLTLYSQQHLRPEHTDLAASCVQFRHLTDAAKQAVRAVGRATIWCGCRSYTTVYPPPALSCGPLS